MHGWEKPVLLLGNVLDTKRRVLEGVSPPTVGTFWNFCTKFMVLCVIKFDLTSILAENVQQLQYKGWGKIPSVLCEFPFCQTLD